MLIQFCEALFDLCEELSSETSMIVNYMLILDLGGFDYRQLTNKDGNLSAEEFLELRIQWGKIKNEETFYFTSKFSACSAKLCQSC